MSNKLDRYYNTLPDIYNPKNNRFVGALIKAWAQEDELISTEVVNTNEQLFVATAVNRYLTNLGLNVDVPRPLYVALEDVYYRDLIYAMSYAPKQVRKTMYDVLDVFWGPTYSRANVNSNNAQNYNFGGDFGLTGTLTFSKNGNTVTGVGTLFTTELAVGNYIKITGQANSAFTKVINIINNTTLVIQDKFLNDTISTTARGYVAKILNVRIDNDAQVNLDVIPKYISNLLSATAQEVSNALNGNDSKATASEIRKDLTTNRYVNLRTNTTGSFGQIQVIGGTANAILNFPTNLNTIDTLQFNTVIYEINPREIVIKLPRLVAKLRRSLKGSIHLNTPVIGNIFSIDNVGKSMVQNLSKTVSSNELANQKFGLDIAESVVQSHGAGQNVLTVNFKPESDLSVFPRGVSKYSFDFFIGSGNISHNYTKYLNLGFYTHTGVPLEIVNSINYQALSNTQADISVSFSASGRIVFVNPDYLHTQVASANVWNVTHNLNVFFPVVTCYQGSDFYFATDGGGSSLLQITSANTLQLLIIAPDTGHIAVLKPTAVFTQPSPGRYFIVEHNLNTEDIVFNFYQGNSVFIPAYYRIIDRNRIEVDLGFSGAGTRVAVAKTPVSDGRYMNPNYLNSFIYNPKANFYPSKKRTVLKSSITANANPVIITVDDASDIPNERGYLVFDFGRSNEETLVPYIGRPNNSTLILDSAYTFLRDHNPNEMINYIPEAKGYDPRDDGSDYAAYITGTKKAMEVVQDLITRLKAVGVVLRWVIKYPEYNFECCDDC